jgi:hypothetical protein
MQKFMKGPKCCGRLSLAELLESVYTDPSFMPQTQAVAMLRFLTAEEDHALVQMMKTKRPETPCREQPKRLSLETVVK